MLINPDPLREFQAGDELYLIGDSGAESAFYERYGYEGGTDRPACEPWSIMRALADGGVDWAAEPFSDMAGKAAPGPGAASVVSEQSMREEHDVLPKGETASHEGMYDERG